VITTDVLPAGRWRVPGDVRTIVAAPPSGVLLGADPLLAPVVLPALGPRPVRLGVLGDQRIAALLAYRLLGVGCLLAVATDDPARWRRLLTAAGSRAVVGARATGWPPATDGPHLLVSDLPEPPAVELGTRPLVTVVHVAARPPAGSAWWAGVDGVLTAGAGHGTALAAALGRPEARELDAVGPGQLGVLDPYRAVAVTPILADAERALLLGPGPPAS
jgi:hypothetical protein